MTNNIISFYNSLSPEKQLEVFLAFQQFQSMMQNAENNPSDGLYKNMCSVLQYQMGDNPDSTLITTQDNAQDTPEGGNNPMAHERTRVLVGTDEQGKAVYKQISGKTQDERNDKIALAYLESGRLNELLDSNPQIAFQHVEQIAEPQKQKTNFKEYAWRCYRTFKEPHLAETSKVRETSALNKLCEYFRSANIEDITVVDVQSWMNERASEGVSSVTINDQRKTLSWILENAVEEDLISKNPAKSNRLNNPGHVSEGTHALSFEETQRLFKLLPSIRNQRKRLLLALFLHTGMRRQEILGLRWEDIDFQNNIINVQRSIVYPDGTAVIKPPKTKKGYRCIPISDALMDELINMVQVKGYLISDDKGNYFQYEDEYLCIFDELKHDIGMPELNARTFRTTYATMAISAGMDVKVVQTIMGHSTSKMTMDVYAKVNSKNVADSRNKVSDYFHNAS